MKKLKKTIYLAMALIIAPSILMAGMARDYLDVPTGSLYPAYYFTYSETKASPLATEIDTQTSLFRMTGTFGIDGKCSGWNILVPYENVKLTNDEGRKFRHSGLGDPTFVFDVNIFGGPALTKEEYKTFVEKTYASLHISLSAPLGDYDKDNPVNTGSNRWSFAPLINYSWTPDAGKSWLEAYAKVTFYTDNKEYQGDKNLSEDPVLGLEFHASNNITKWMWLALDLFYDYGGETSVDGVWQENRSNTLSAGFTANFIPWHHGKILLQYKDTLSAPSDAAQTRALTLYIAQLF